VKKQTTSDQAPKGHTYTIHETAKEIGVGPNIFFGMLKGRGVLRCGNLPSQTYIDSGYLTVENVRYTQCVPKARVTEKGLEYLKKMFKEKKTLDV
jgi:phage antirepressor YoqD-like protein